METENTIIIIQPIPGLAKYLDHLCLNWNFVLEPGATETKIQIDFGQNMSISDLLIFGIDFRNWLLKNEN
ncbi:MAG: hypothetical protein ACKOQP_03170 [Bacteroidota bacterium]